MYWRASSNRRCHFSATPPAAHCLRVPTAEPAGAGTPCCSVPGPSCCHARCTISCACTRCPGACRCDACCAPPHACSAARGPVHARTSRPGVVRSFNPKRSSPASPMQSNTASATVRGRGGRQREVGRGQRSLTVSADADTWLAGGCTAVGASGAAACHRKDSLPATLACDREIFSLGVIALGHNAAVIRGREAASKATRASE